MTTGQMADVLRTRVAAGVAYFKVRVTVMVMVMAMIVMVMVVAMTVMVMVVLILKHATTITSLSPPPSHNQKEISAMSREQLETALTALCSDVFSNDALVPLPHSRPLLSPALAVYL